MNVRNAVLIAVHIAAAAIAQVVSIDPTVTYRTIEGLGFCEPPASMYKIKVGPFYHDAQWESFADTLINYVGMSMSRGFSTKSCEFNPAPGQFVITAGIRHEMQQQRLLKSIADSAGEVYRYSPNVFSPPGWMKWNGRCDGGHESSYQSDTTNSLMPNRYADFGALCSAFIRVSRDSFNVPVYAFSPQNEPWFNEPYASCSYRDGWHFARMLRAVGPAVKRADPATLIYGAEHMLWAFPQWEAAVLADAEAGPFLDRFAVHGATSSTDVDTAGWLSLRQPRTRDLWVSEFNWHDKGYDTCFGQASSVLARLGDGANMTAYLAGGSYLFWDAAEPGGAKTHVYYLNAQFMRFVRPGMVRIQASCDEPMIRVIAFKNDTTGSFSVVMLNGTTQDAQVTLQSTIPLPDSLETRVTTAAQGFVEGPLYNATSPITVPARGMVSLGYRIRGAHTAHARRAAISPLRYTAAESVGARFYDLRGRILAPQHMSARYGGFADGVYIRLSVVRGSSEYVRITITAP